MDNINSNPIVYKLKKPLLNGQETITELTFMEPNIGLLKRADGCKGDMEKTAKLIEVLCNILPRLVDEISTIDLVPIGDIIKSFFPPSQET